MKLTGYENLAIFGTGDTINPFSGIRESQKISNNYLIESFGDLMGVVYTNLLPNYDTIADAVFNIIEPSTGETIAILTPTVLLQSRTEMPNTNECVNFNINEQETSFWLNSVYIGKILQIEMQVYGMLITAQDLNNPRGYFGEIRNVASDVELSGSWLLCDGTQGLNEYLYPKMSAILKEKLSQDEISYVDGYYYVNFNGLFLRGSGTSARSSNYIGGSPFEFQTPSVMSHTHNTVLGSHTHNITLKGDSIVNAQYVLGAGSAAVEKSFYTPTVSSNSDIVESTDLGTKTTSSQTNSNSENRVYSMGTKIYMYVGEANVY